MPRPRPPCRIEPLSFPVFGIAWFCDPSTGRSIVAYAGGGGSARTGIFNNVVIQDGEDATDPVKISTGDEVGVALHIYQSARSRAVWMVVALGGSIHRYSLTADAKLNGVLQVVTVDDGHDHDATAASNSHAKDFCSAVAVNANADQLAVGCDSGIIKIYDTTDESLSPSPAPLFVCNGHTKSICALDFSSRGGTLLSSAKDGTARIWDCMETGESLSELICDCSSAATTPAAASSQRQQQILVRGCAFADIDGHVALTVASARLPLPMVAAKPGRALCTSCADGMLSVSCVRHVHVSRWTIVSIGER
jgi:WD40 repeat protein